MLESLIIPHRECEDSYYSCDALTGDWDTGEPSPCSCGADKHNAKVRAIEQALEFTLSPKLREELAQEVAAFLKQDLPEPKTPKHATVPGDFDTIAEAVAEYGSYTVVHVRKGHVEPPMSEECRAAFAAAKDVRVIGEPGTGFEWRAEGLPL